MSDDREARDLLSTWQQRLRTITANANELSGAESTRRVRAAHLDGGYSGVTQARAAAALAMLDQLMDDYLLLARVVDEAAQVGKASLFMSRDTKAARIAALLEGPSIARLLARVDLKDRSLLGDALSHARMTPQALLSLMQDHFTRARDALTEIDAAQRQGAKALDGLRSDFAAMQARATRLKSGSGQPSFIELPALASDPLNARDGIESLRRGLRCWSEQLDDAERAREQAQSGLLAVRGALDELERLGVEHAGLVESVRAQFGDAAAAGLVLDQAGQRATLRSWAETLETSLANGQFHSVAVGVGRIRVALQAAIAQATAASAAARAQAGAVAELQGVLGALKFKEQAFRDSGIAAHAQAAQAARTTRKQIETLLQARPVNLDHARTLLARYQSSLLHADARLRH
jgi:hypothetical protein